jgi:hypothetical protein
VEALAMSQESVDSVVLVSLGTGASPAEPKYESTQTWLGVVKDTMAVATSVQAGHLLCQRILNQTNYFRLQVVDRDVSGAMDDASAGRLANLEAAAQKMIEKQSDTLDQLMSRLRPATQAG